jgi:hypothetical protein
VAEHCFSQACAGHHKPMLLHTWSVCTTTAARLDSLSPDNDRSGPSGHGHSLCLISILISGPVLLRLVLSHPNCRATSSTSSLASSLQPHQPASNSCSREPSGLGQVVH